MAWQPRTLRTRLLLGLGIVVAVALTAVPVAMSWLVSSYLDDRVSTRLDDTVGQVGGLLSGRDVVRLKPQAELGTAAGVDAVVVAIGPEGERLTSLATPGDDEDAAGLVAATAGIAPDDTTRTEVDGVPYIAVRTSTEGLRVLTGSRTVEVDEVLVGIDVSADAKLAARVRAYGLVIALVVLALTAVVTSLVVRRGLRPLEDMASAADEVAAGGTRVRLSDLAHAPDDESARLGRAVDAALDARAEAEMRMRRFVSDASHELRTPLTTIAGWTEHYLQGGVPPGEVDAAMARIESEVGRMRVLVDELHLLSRADEGRPLDLAAVDLVPLVSEVVEAATMVAPDRPLELEVPRCAVVTGDDARLRQVVGNVVGNVVRHTPPGTAARVAVRACGETTEIVVSDDGPGLAPDDLGHLFERFWRADASRSRPTVGGSGLGLAIVDALVGAHGGSVSAASPPGEGLTVTVRLPTGGPGPASGRG